MSSAGVLINSNQPSAELSNHLGQEVVALPATGLATEVLGRPVPNTALLAAFLTLTGLLPHKALVKALSARFKGDVLERNARLVEQAASRVPADIWKEVHYAARA